MKFEPQRRRLATAGRFDGQAHETITHDKAVQSISGIALVQIGHLYFLDFLTDF